MHIHTLKGFGNFLFQIAIQPGNYYSLGKFPQNLPNLEALLPDPYPNTVDILSTRQLLQTIFFISDIFL